MAVSVTDSQIGARAAKAAEPIFELLRRGDFEDVTRRRRAAMRVMRRSRDGLSVYVRSDSSNSRELTKHRARYTIVYEGEDDTGTEVQYTILESDETRSVLELLDLLNAHAQRVRECVLARLCTVPLGRDLVEQCGRFDDSREREAILHSLAQLAMKPVSDLAVQGFIQAVLSRVDDWLSHRREDDLDD